MNEKSDKELNAPRIKVNNYSIDDEEIKAQKKGTTSTTLGVLEVIVNDDDVPLTPAQSAALYPSLEIVKEDVNSTDPLPMEHIAALMEAAPDDTNFVSAMKLKIESNVDLPQVAGADSEAQFDIEERIPSGAEMYVSERALPQKNTGYHDHMERTTTPHQHSDLDQNTPAFTVLEATLVDDVVYDAIPFQMDQEMKESPGDKDFKAEVTHAHPGWCKRHARRIFVGLVTVAVALTAIIVVILNSNKNGTGANDNIWKEQGNPILGNNIHDKLGIAIAFSAGGRILAIGACGSYEDMDHIGYVKTYRRSNDGSRWEKIGQDIRGYIKGDNFGAAVALSADGTILAIGAPAFGSKSEDINGMPGYSRVYYLVEGADSWQQIGRDITGEAPADNFGTSISLSGDGKTVAIGAMRGDKNNTVLNSGRVSIYQIKDEGYVWTQLGNNNGGETQSSSSGWVVNASSDWTQLGQDILGEAAEDNAGYAMSLSTEGRTVAIGSPFAGDLERGLESGNVRVFAFDDVTSSWVQQGPDIIGNRDERFGYYVATSANGESFAIGAPAQSANKPGYVRVFSLKDRQQIGDDIVGTTTNGEFGTSLSLSEDGKTIAVSDIDTGDGKGCVTVFKFKVSSRTWEQHGEAITGGIPNNWFGHGVSLSGDGKMVAIGAPYEENDNGAVWIYSERNFIN